MCLYPLRIRNPTYDSLADAQHRSVFSSVSDSPIPADYMLDVPCGKCWQCLRAKRFETILRLKLEQYAIPPGTRSYFVTLTFNDVHLARFRDTYRITVRRWVDRLRKRYGKFRFYFVSELGDKNGRFHFHGILFGLPNIPYSELCASWPHGISFFGYCTERTCGYITKYFTKQQVSAKFKYRPLLFYSKSYGLTPVCIDIARRFLTYRNPTLANPDTLPDCIQFPMAIKSCAIPIILMRKLFGDEALLHRRLQRVLDGCRYVYRGVTYPFREMWYNAILLSRSEFFHSDRYSKPSEIPTIRLPGSVRFRYLIDKLTYYGSEFQPSVS